MVEKVVDKFGDRVVFVDKLGILSTWVVQLLTNCGYIQA